MIQYGISHTFLVGNNCEACSRIRESILKTFHEVPLYSLERRGCDEHIEESRAIVDTYRFMTEGEM